MIQRLGYAMRRNTDAVTKIVHKFEPGGKIPWGRSQKRRIDVVEGFGRLWNTKLEEDSTESR
jgi:hypothetical protein